MSWNCTVYVYASNLELNVLGVEEGTATRTVMLYANDQPVDVEAFNNSVMSIMAGADDPCRAAMVLDIMKYSTYVNSLIINGAEGRRWFSEGPGFISNGPEYKQYTPNAMAWAWGVNNGNYVLMPDRTDFAEMQEFCNAHIGVNPTMSFVFDTGEIAAYAAAIAAAVEEHEAALIMGLVEDPEAACAAFLDSLEQSGMQTCIDKYMSQYTAWYEAL